MSDGNDFNRIRLFSKDYRLWKFLENTSPRPLKVRGKRIRRFTTRFNLAGNRLDRTRGNFAQAALDLFAPGGLRHGKVVTRILHAGVVDIFDRYSALSIWARCSVLLESI